MHVENCSPLNRTTRNPQDAWVSSICLLPVHTRVTTFPSRTTPRHPSMRTHKLHSFSCSCHEQAARLPDGHVLLPHLGTYQFNVHKHLLPFLFVFNFFKCATNRMLECCLLTPFPPKPRGSHCATLHRAVIFRYM